MFYSQRASMCEDRIRTWSKKWKLPHFLKKKSAYNNIYRTVRLNERNFVGGGWGICNKNSWWWRWMWIWEFFLFVFPKWMIICPEPDDYSLPLLSHKLQKAYVLSHHHARKWPFDIMHYFLTFFFFFFCLFSIISFFFGLLRPKKNFTKRKTENFYWVKYCLVHVQNSQSDHHGTPAGLKRTGKSCRLRWLNYLRPDVRRGNITLEEQLMILELHSRWGNR